MNTLDTPQKPLYKKGGFWIITIVVLLILISALSGSSTPAKTTTPPPVASSTPLTPQEQAISFIGNNAIQGTMDITYSDVDISDDTTGRPADSGRPKGSKEAIVSFNLSNSDSHYFTTVTSGISSKVFQGVFANDPSIYDVVVWFHDPSLVDQYGNKAEQNVVTSLSIDRPTFEKINWTGFDPSNMCNFLTTVGQTDMSDGVPNEVCFVKSGFSN